MDVSSLFSTLPGGDQAPEWLHLVPAGTFRGRDGRGPYRLKDPAAVIEASMAEGKLPIDENHATDFAMESGRPSPARGWIVELQARDDGLWGRIEWNESGRALMADRAYRGVSPVFVHDKEGTVTRLLRAALTNTPNLPQLAMLHGAAHAALDAEQRNKLDADQFAVPGKREMPIHDAEHVKLAWDMVDRTQGLSEAERAEARRRILAKAKSLGLDTQGWKGAAQAAGAGDMDIAGLRQALGLAGTADEAAVLAAAKAASETVARQVAELAALKRDAVPTERVVALQAELDKIKAERAEERARGFIDAAIKEGKPIVAVREQLIAQHVANAEATEKLVKGMRSIHAGGIVVRHDAADGDPVAELSEIDKDVAKKMGIDLKAFAEHRRKMRAAANDGRVA